MKLEKIGMKGNLTTRTRFLPKDMGNIEKKTMKKSLKTLKKEYAIARLNLLELYIRDLLRNRNQKLKAEVSKEISSLKESIKDI